MDHPLEHLVGSRASRQFAVTEGLITAFADLSGDRSPVHLDDAHAQRLGFRGRLAHGALQAALASCVLGMDLPGECGVLQELSLQFRGPCYAGDTLTVTVSVTEAFESVGALRLAIRIANQEGAVVATGRAQSGVSTT